jgi:hypothetical protein
MIHRRVWEYNIKMDLEGIGCNDMDCVYVAQNRV